MKTKNILKIGIFSIVLFGLLISPVLKTNLSRVAANGQPTDEIAEFCTTHSSMNIEDWGKEQDPEMNVLEAKTFYYETCCIPEYDWEDKQIMMNNRCESIGATVTGIADSLGSEEIATTLQEKRANDVCNEIDYTAIIEECAKNHDVIYKNTVCRAKASFAQAQCEIVIGTIEGLGMMFSGIMNSEIKWILETLNPATYGGMLGKGVQAIWTLLRNIVNSLLVLGLIGIAIATILGYKKYAWKQILWKLILVALLVNFSLVISGIIVDTSNYFAGYFLSMSQKNGSIAPRIMAGYDYTKVEGTANGYTPPKLFGDDKYKAAQIEMTEDGEVKEEGVGKFTIGLGNAFIVAFITILVGGFAVIALLAIYLTMIFRNAFLIVLLGLSPIAFATWIFPDTEKYWKMWWDNFLKWCSFPIIFAFSLYLGLTVISNMPSIDPNSSMTTTIIYMTLFSVFLVGGLIFAVQGGGVISKNVMQQASKIGAATGAFISKKTTGAVKESSTYKKAGKLLTKVPLLGGVGQEMMVAGEKAKIARVKEHEKNLENVGLGTLKELEKASAPSPLDRNAYERRIGLTNKLADIGELSKESVEFIKMHQGDTRLDASAITKAIPHYFKLEEGQLVETGKPIKSKVEALGRIKSDKMREKTQSSDFIKNIVDDRKDRASVVAMSRGKTKEEAEEFANRTADSTFDKTIQEIINTLSPAQMAAFWHSLSPKDLIKKGWGGPDGKIMKAIGKDPATKKKFEQHLNDSKPLRAESGIDPQIFHPDTDSPDTDPDELERIENIFK